MSSINTQLSLDTINEHEEKINWGLISMHPLSEANVNWGLLASNPFDPNTIQLLSALDEEEDDEWVMVD